VKFTGRLSRDQRSSDWPREKDTENTEILSVFSVDALLLARGTKQDVTPDARRFLLFKPLEEASQTPITVVANWPSLLKK
jgi:hypothetical protein